jgi:UDP-3-O-[3-hydroxymyristoyl] glucosamine N-acyltransferase
VPTLLSDIVDALGGEVRGDQDFQVWRLASLEQAGREDMSFCSAKQPTLALRQTRAGCLILSAENYEAMGSSLPARSFVLVGNPSLYFARLTQWWKRIHMASSHQPLIHPTASIHPSAHLAADVRVGPFAYVGPHVELDSHAVIGPHSVIEEGVTIGAGTRLVSRVTIYAGCHLGHSGLLHSGVVIGADGFGFAQNGDQGWEKIEQLGGVRIGHSVEIGANTCIDRGTLDDTVISDGVKLDNLIQIGHNVHIGVHTALAGCVGVAGSAYIGAYCTVGGAANIFGHLRIADHVHIAGTSVVTRSILKAGHYCGIFPLDEKNEWEKNGAVVRQLYRLRERVRHLESRSPRSFSSIESAHLHTEHKK